MQLCRALTGSLPLVLYGNTNVIVSSSIVYCFRNLYLDPKDGAVLTSRAGHQRGHSFRAAK